MIFRIFILSRKHRHCPAPTSFHHAPNDVLLCPLSVSQACPFPQVPLRLPWLRPRPPAPAPPSRLSVGLWSLLEPTVIFLVSSRKFQCHPISHFRRPSGQGPACEHAGQGPLSCHFLPGPPGPSTPGSCKRLCTGALISHGPVLWYTLFPCPEHPCSWPGPRLGPGVISFRLSLAPPGSPST